MSKRGALSGLLFESKLTIYELVSIINQMTGKCKRHASICIHQREAPSQRLPCGGHVVKSKFFHDLLSFGFLSLFHRSPGNGPHAVHDSQKGR